MNRFDELYRGTPPWDTGRPQPAIHGLLEDGRIRGRVLDMGCGTGENTLMLAAAGLDVTGVDVSPRALVKARIKAQERGLDVPFREVDALDPPADLGPFDTIIDSGVFHVFNDDDRARYVQSLAALTKPGGRVHLIVFSQHEPAWGGPRRVTKEEIQEAFAAGWSLVSIEKAAYEINLDHGPARAWLATAERSAV